MQEAANLQGSPSTCMGMALDVVRTTCRHWYSRSPWPPTCKAACESVQSESRARTEGWMGASTRYQTDVANEPSSEGLRPNLSGKGSTETRP